MNIYFQNVRGLRTKTHTCYLNILAGNYDIIIFVESWLCDGILSSELCDDRYDTFRFDRDLLATNKSTGGGVMICTRRELAAVQRDDLSCSPTELLWVTIPAAALQLKYDLHIIGSYIPGDRTQVSNLSTYANLVTNFISNNPLDNYLMAGDFNLPFIEWEYSGPIYNTGGTSVEIQSLAKDLINQLTLSGFLQHNMILNSHNKILDLILSNFNIELTRCSSPLIKEDLYHPSLFIDASDITLPPLTHAPIRKYKFFKGDYASINSKLNETDWETAFLNKTTDEAINLFYERIYECIDLYIPVAITHKNNNFPAWYSTSLVKIIREKDKAHKKWKKYGNHDDYHTFSLLRARFHRVQRACYNKMIFNAQHSIRNNPKKLWNFVQSKKGSSKYPTSLTLGDTRLCTGPDIADGFNNFFEKMFLDKLPHYPALDLPPPQNGTTDFISTISINEVKVLQLLSDLDTNKGSGCDNVAPFFIVKCAKSISKPLTLIFNMSINEGVFPTIWKKARIVPVHKKGLKSKVENYRPVSILNIFSKIFERIVYDAIYSVIANAVPVEQHGFLKGRSTITNLSIFSNYIISNMEKGRQVDVVYTDFEKAFDRVDHAILIQKLEKLGISGNLLRWTESYLSNRSQMVVVGGYKSNYVTIPSGVPQGSLLGPLLYNSYLYDVYTCIKHSRFLMYADDTKLYTDITNIQDASKLQNDLYNLEEYYQRNRITVNAKKCNIISFGRKRQPIICNYTINNVPLERVSLIRDLGVYLDTKFSLIQHIDMICTKAYKTLGFIMRTCSVFSNSMCIKTVYFAYVRSILEYGCSIWSPNYIIHKQHIESIQKKFISFLCYRTRRSYLNYEEGCNGFHLLSLENRRIMLDMMLLYDLMNSRVDCPELVGRVLFLAPRRRTRRPALLHAPPHRTNYGLNEPLTRLTRLYNKLFGEIDPFHQSKPTFRKNIIRNLLET